MSRIILLICYFGLTNSYAVVKSKAIVVNFIKQRFVEEVKLYNTGYSLISVELINKLEYLDIPEQDIPDAHVVKLFKNEDPELFYYGYKGSPIDYDKARIIAYANFLS